MALPPPLDMIVRQKLRGWPQRPPGLMAADARRAGTWLRARPGAAPGTPEECEGPFLKLPGSWRMRTMPDGLWLYFGGRPEDPYADIFVIEACGGIPNLRDKRSRFAPSMHSMLVVCPLRWLRGTVEEYGALPRWRLCGMFKAEPAGPLILPVRDIRVLYALKPRDYQGFAECNVPHAHEFFAPIEALIGAGGWRDPAMEAFLARASVRANFWVSAPARRPDRIARGFDCGGSEIGPVGDDPVDPRLDQSADLHGVVDCPGEDLESEGLRLVNVARLQRGRPRRPASRPEPGHCTGEVAAMHAKIDAFQP